MALPHDIGLPLVLQAVGQGEYNPLLSLALNDALASINGFLASSLR